MQPFLSVDYRIKREASPFPLLCAKSNRKIDEDRHRMFYESRKVDVMFQRAIEIFFAIAPSLHGENFYRLNGVRLFCSFVYSR